MKRREWVATQIRATLANGGPIHGSTLVAWAKELDSDGVYCTSDNRYLNRTYQDSKSAVTVHLEVGHLSDPEAIARQIAFAITKA